MGETPIIVKTMELLPHLNTADFGNVFLPHLRGYRLPKMDNHAIANPSHDNIHRSNEATMPAALASPSG
jgi:hypothetical protein